MATNHKGMEKELGRGIAKVKTGIYKGCKNSALTINQSDNFQVDWFTLTADRFVVQVVEGTR